MAEFEKTLEEIYFDPSHFASFGGVEKLFKAASAVNETITRKDVKDWLSAQQTYSLFKPVKRKFNRLPILVDRLDEKWQADLMDVSWWKHSNDGVVFLLVVIDVLSRFAWVIPLRDKSARSVTAAFIRVFEKRKPEKLQTDQGTEFKYSLLKDLLDRNNIKHFTTKDDSIKCAIAERFNRTLREKIYQYMHHNNTNRYIDALDDIVHSYNDSHHRTIQMKPKDVNEDNVARVLANIRKSLKFKDQKHSLNIGDVVKIPRKKGTFEKGAASNWTVENFKVRSKKKTPHKYIYKLADVDGEEIEGVFYPEEVNKVVEPKEYKIEKVLRKRTNKSTLKPEYFVKWLGFPDKFNSWVQDDDFLH